MKKLDKIDKLILSKERIEHQLILEYKRTRSSRIYNCFKNDIKKKLFSLDDEINIIKYELAKYDKVTNLDKVANMKFVYYFIYNLLGIHNYSLIGRKVNRNHGTVMSGIKNVEGLIEVDKKIKEKVELVKERIITTISITIKDIKYKML